MEAFNYAARSRERDQLRAKGSFAASVSRLYHMCGMAPSPGWR